MEFNPSNESEFLQNPFFVKWVKQPNEHTDRYWENWCVENPDKKEILLRAKEIVRGLQPREANKINQESFQSGLDKLIEVNNSGKFEKKHSNIRRGGHRRMLTWGSSVAASILIMGVMAMSYVWFKNQSSLADEKVVATTMINKSVPKGMKKTILLPDSSMVTLNAGSTLSFPEEFAEIREVHLKGQAFFDIKRDENRPFVVKSGDLRTTVLGTSFDIKAYEDQNELHVAVVTGKVKVITLDGIETQISPMEATFFDVGTGAMRKGRYDYEMLVGWKDKILKFHNASYEDVFQELSNWYDVTFVLPKGFEEIGVYTGRFENQMLENVLKGMEYSTGLKFKIKGKKVFVIDK